MVGRLMICCVAWLLAPAFLLLFPCASRASIMCQDETHGLLSHHLMGPAHSQTPTFSQQRAGVVKWPCAYLICGRCRIDCAHETGETHHRLPFPRRGQADGRLWSDLDTLSDN
jgi:hypothetical protein